MNDLPQDYAEAAVVLTPKQMAEFERQREMDFINSELTQVDVDGLKWVLKHGDGVDDLHKSIPICAIKKIVRQFELILGSP